MLPVSRRACFAGLGCLALSACAGCTRKWDEGATTHYSFELWVGLLVTVGCLLAIPGGWLLRLASERLGYGILIAAIFILALIAPSLFTDHVTLNDEGFTLRTGLWVSPTLHDVKFNDLEAIELTTKTTRGRRGRKNRSRYMECVKRAGGVAAVPIGNLMNDAYQDILRRAHDHGIQIRDHRNLEEN